MARMNEKPRRRWFVFSLRTLLVLITVLSVWLGSVTNQVRERRAALADLRGRGAWISTSTRAPGNRHLTAIPIFRRWLGDVAVQYVNLFPENGATEDEIRRLQPLFPECRFKLGTNRRP